LKHAPAIRVRALNPHERRSDGRYVLYWMVGFRRPRWNFALQHAAAHASELGKPLVILEALRVGYRWASDRLHKFILDGMRDHEAHFAGKNVLYFPYVEPTPGEGKGLLAELTKNACLVVSDDYPTFFIPKMQKVAAERMNVCCQVVDSNGLLPIRAADKAFSRAFHFRRHLQKTLLGHVDAMPLEDPLPDDALERAPSSLLEEVQKRWPRATPEALGGETLPALAIDHQVAIVDFEGGFAAGESRAASFLESTLDRYAEDRNHPDADASSGLSPWLHFGHVSSHQIFHELARDQGWSPDQVSEKTGGQREGWWGMTQNAESFLDELITWRELGFNMCAHRGDFDQFESLPDWAKDTLAEHENDPREHVYSLERLAASDTHDAVWNAAQTELRETGRLHNYMRMLWGKKILEWSPTPRDALEAMIELNNKYAVDGRDPNSYSGIFWVLGRYDRAWGPERPIYGKVRYMTSASARRKLRMNDYLAKFGGQEELF